MDPEQLFEQAETLLALPRGGAPRQVDKRRAVSSAYYGLFHFTIRAAADLLVGVGSRGTSRHTLVYRSVDHRRFRGLCLEVVRRNRAAARTAYLPTRGFGSDLGLMAASALVLQEARHSADYDPTYRINLENARNHVASARRAAEALQAADLEARAAFLTLLVCDPRG